MVEGVQEDLTERRSRWADGKLRERSQAAENGVYLRPNKLNGKSRSAKKNGKNGSGRKQARSRSAYKNMKRRSPCRVDENGANRSVRVVRSGSKIRVLRDLKKGSKRGCDNALWERSEIERKAESLSQRYSQCLENYKKKAEDPFEKFGSRRFGDKWAVYMNRLMNYPRYVSSSYLVTMNHFTCSSRGKPLSVLYTSFGYERECVEKLLDSTKVSF